jgi:hypothetical protein
MHKLSHQQHNWLGKLSEKGNIDHYRLMTNIALLTQFAQPIVLLMRKFVHLM